MSRNSKNNVEERSKAANRNNINIQINFNMKDKNQGFTGKKVENVVQIDHKNNSKTDSYSKTAEDPKKNKKKQHESSHRPEKEKNFDTPLKHRYIELNKVIKNHHEKTPDKISRKDERSKSTTRKLVKRKNAKSMDNLKAGAIRYTRNKSPQSSSEKSKSKSRSKSGKKQFKSIDQSSKNLFGCSNSSLKSKGVNQKGSNQSRERTVSGVGKKGSREEESEKVKKYMEEKKRKERAENSRKGKELKSRRERINEELRRVEVERRANASKPVRVSKKLLEEQKQRLPMYFPEDEDEFQESEDYERHNKEASDLLHESPPREDPFESIPIAKYRRLEQGCSSGKKSQGKRKRGELVYRYLNGTITQRQLSMLEEAVSKIQRFYRGCLARRQFVAKLNNESTKYKYIKNNLDNKPNVFWNNEEDNSIVNIEKDSSIKVYDSGSSSINFDHFHSHPQSQHSGSELVPDQSSKTDRFKKLTLPLSDSGDDFQGSKERSERQTHENSKMLKEIEQLRKLLENQNKKLECLQQENEILRDKKASLQQSRELKGSNQSEDLIRSIDKIEIRMPQKIRPNEIIIDEPEESQEKSLEESRSRELSLQAGRQAFKRHFQQFQCSSPSNARIAEQLKQLRQKNVETMFEKKEIKVEEKYEKKVTLLKNTLRDKLISPRTFHMKKKDLDEKLHFEKQEIKEKKKETRNVLEYFEDVQSEESEGQGEKEHVDAGLRVSNIGEVEPNFKKNKNLVESGVNTSPHQIRKVVFNPSAAEVKEEAKKDENEEEYSSEEQRAYKYYWQDNNDEVHKHAIEIASKIEEALKASSEEQSSRKEDLREFSSGSDYQLEGYHSYDSSKNARKQGEEKGRVNHGYSKSLEGDVNLDTLKQAYEDYMDEIKEMPSESEKKEMLSESEKKAREIFKKIDPLEDIDCNSEEEEVENNSHDNICRLLNDRPLSAHGSKSSSPNLYVSEAQFNQKKRKEEELSRSSSFEKSNKSLSMNNSSHTETKGFITNLTFIKEFCISVCEFVRNHETWKDLFVDKISKPSHYDLAEYLRAYRVTVAGEVKNNYNTFTDQYIYPYFRAIAERTPTITPELFAEFMKAFEEEKSSNIAWNDSLLNKKSKEMREYFLVCIIDTFNEALEYERPGSVHGQALPWLNHCKHLKNHKNCSLKEAGLERRYYSGSSEEQTEEERRLDQIFGTSIAKLIQWGSCLCGFIADPMPMEMGDSQIANLSDQQLNSIRENRVGLMLERWLLEEEEEMTNATPEYTEVALCLSEKIYEALLLECTDEIQELIDQ